MSIYQIFLKFFIERLIANYLTLVVLIQCIDFIGYKVDISMIFVLLIKDIYLLTKNI